MKQVTVVEKKTKVVEVEEEKTMYEANDGTRWATEDAANRREAFLILQGKLNKIKNVTLTMYGVADRLELYYVTSKDEVDTLVEKYPELKEILDQGVTPPEWICFEMYDGQAYIMDDSDVVNFAANILKTLSPDLLTKEEN